MAVIASLFWWLLWWTTFVLLVCFLFVSCLFLLLLCFGWCWCCFWFLCFCVVGIHSWRWCWWWPHACFCEFLLLCVLVVVLVGHTCLFLVSVRWFCFLFVVVILEYSFPEIHCMCVSILPVLDVLFKVFEFVVTGKWFRGEICL